MDRGRTLLLFDPAAQPQSWNERMTPGEFAVLYSGAVSGAPDVATCEIFPSLSEAEEYAARQTALFPALRCRIYDHHGLAGQPVREIRGSQFIGESEISGRFRRWAGSLLFFGGIALFAMDWRAGFSLSWPAMLGVRMMPVGLFLLVVELMIFVSARRKKVSSAG